MRVLVIGASGFIGNEAAKAISRAGHQVLGQTRSQDKAKDLAAEEFKPVVQDPMKMNDWLPQYADVDVILEAGGGNAAEGIPKRFREIRDFAAKQRPHGPPLTYIKVSGTWLHGVSAGTIKTEGDILTEPIELTAWRIPVEREIVSSQSHSFRGIVVRGALLYGKNGSLMKPMFQSASKGHIEWFAETSGYAATIHVDDLAELLALVVSKSPLLAGLIIDAAAFNESVFAFTQELKRVSGAQSIARKEPKGLFETALATNQRLNPTLARDLLGWHPRKPSLTDGMDFYYASYLASL